ncbi:MAG: AbrB/MazE/SpoVT family DNA-binding domain-containing protein [Pseudomonadota bacterium]|nr:AbrB/MazE/SpoVT family DNA-binding domain-containing protein [Pseudomonadota bacterium]
MKVARWGNSLAVRLPTIVAEALELKEGDDIDIRLAGQHSFEVEKRADNLALLARLRKYRGRMPPDFKFDRLEIYERD